VEIVASMAAMCAMSGWPRPAVALEVLGGGGVAGSVATDDTVVQLVVPAVE
jgi:hypothetical protein